MRAFILAGALALLAGVTLADDTFVAKDKKFTVVMVTAASMSGTKSASEMTSTYTITSVSADEIHYDVKTSGKGSSGGSS